MLDGPPTSPAEHRRPTKHILVQFRFWCHDNLRPKNRAKSSRPLPEQPEQLSGSPELGSTRPDHRGGPHAQ